LLGGQFRAISRFFQNLTKQGGCAQRGCTVECIACFLQACHFLADFCRLLSVGFLVDFVRVQLAPISSGRSIVDKLPWGAIIRGIISPRRHCHYRYALSMCQTCRVAAARRGAHSTGNRSVCDGTEAAKTAKAAKLNSSMCAASRAGSSQCLPSLSWTDSHLLQRRVASDILGGKQHALSLFITFMHTHAQKFFATYALRHPAFCHQPCPTLQCLVIL